MRPVRRDGPGATLRFGQRKDLVRLPWTLGDDDRSGVPDEPDHRGGDGARGVITDPRELGGTRTSGPRPTPRWTTARSSTPRLQAAASERRAAPT